MDDVTFRLFQSAWNVLGAIGLLVASAVALAYWIFKSFATKWLDQKFNRQLEDYKHQQSVELEALKFKINGLIDRTVKIYVKEFEYLPQVWAQLYNAHEASKPLLGTVRDIYNLNAMPIDRLDQFLETTELNELEKYAIRDADNKDVLWNRMLDIKSYNNSITQHAELTRLLSHSSIFFSNEIRQEIQQFADIIWSAIAEYRVYYLDKDDSVQIERFARNRIREEGEARLRALEEKIRDRLWNAEKAEL